MTRGIIYCRESKTVNGQSTLLKQELRCRQYCKDHKIKAIKAYKEVNTRARHMKNGKRLETMIKRLKKGDLLIIPRVDRLSRHYKHGLKFLKETQARGINVHSVDENIDFKNNQAKFKTLLKSAENFSNELSEKMKTICEILNKKGWYFGKAKFGYKAVYDNNGIRKIKKNFEEQATINYIFNCKCNDKSCENIARDLNKRKIRYRNKNWNRKNVKYILQSNK